jgi:hypothetical protein
LAVLQVCGAEAEEEEEQQAVQGRAEDEGRAEAVEERKSGRRRAEERKSGRGRAEEERKKATRQATPAAAAAARGSSREEAEEEGRAEAEEEEGQEAVHGRRKKKGSRKRYRTVGNGSGHQRPYFDCWTSFDATVRLGPTYHTRPHQARGSVIRRQGEREKGRKGEREKGRKGKGRRGEKEKRRKGEMEKGRNACVCFSTCTTRTATACTMIDALRKGNFPKWSLFNHAGGHSQAVASWEFTHVVNSDVQRISLYIRKK